MKHFYACWFLFGAALGLQFNPGAQATSTEIEQAQSVKNEVSSKQASKFTGKTVVSGEVRLDSDQAVTTVRVQTDSSKQLALAEAPLEKKLETKLNSGFSLEPLESSRASLKKMIYEEYDSFQRHDWDKVVSKIDSLYGNSIEYLSRQYQVEAPIIYGIMAIESRGNSNAKSYVGAKGLMQIYSIPSYFWDQARTNLGYSKDKKLNVWNTWHNMHLGLVTLTLYTRGIDDQEFCSRKANSLLCQGKNNDLLMGMVAYNWGPKRRAYQYGNHFMEMRHKIPISGVRKYPIKAYAVALMKKVMDQHGQALPYELNCTKQYNVCRWKGNPKEKCLKQQEICQYEETEYRKLIEAIQLPGIDY